MERLESYAWPVACGAGTVFAVAVLLEDTGKADALTAVAVVVALWALWAPLLAGVTVAGIGWLAVTGFDVNHTGDLRFSGWSDLVRLAVLLGVAVLAAGIGRPARRAGAPGDVPPAPDDLVWAAPHRLVASPREAAREEGRPVTPMRVDRRPEYRGDN